LRDCGCRRQTSLREETYRASCPKFFNGWAIFKERLDTIAVESTYNWYWLVDGLQDAGYRVVLANPAGMETIQ